MGLDASAPWHRESFDRFLYERLPQLLADRLPLAGYQVEEGGEHCCKLRVAVSGPAAEVEAEYADLPRPDEMGLFRVKGEPMVVVPVAEAADLAAAEIRCVGEQLYEMVAEFVTAAPERLEWDERLLRTWLPLDSLIKGLLSEKGQWLDGTNWLASRTHLRRIYLDLPERPYREGHWGRVCPFETAEGPNIGRALTTAVGAEIRAGRLVRTDERPEAALGLTASMVPFLEHDDLNRGLMGVNMMRQWWVPPDPEPALVRTGNEIDAPGFWCGRNLLTAFVNWGADTFEDGAVISESCADRLAFPAPIEPGDKLSNRHGIKGVVNRILPDDEMPHLDGTPVEIAWDFMGLPSRIGLIGALREAVAGRLARAEGQPVIAPPFQGPGEEELRARLARAGLREDGMERLTLGRGGLPLQHASTVGWVYWGRVHHFAAEKIRAAVEPEAGEWGAWIARLGPGNPGALENVRGQQDPRSGGEWQGEAEYGALRKAGAWENIREQFNTRAAERPDAGTLAARAAAGEVPEAGPPTPAFAALTERLAAAGIRAALDGERLAFRFAPVEGPRLELARPVPHPWLRERELREVGQRPDLAEHRRLELANRRLARALENRHPQALVRQAEEQVENCVRALFDALLRPEHLRWGARALFSGHAVAACGPELRVDQVGLPPLIAWALFGPAVARETGAEAVAARTEGAAQALEAAMGRSWVLVARRGHLAASPVLAFRPVLLDGRVIRIPPLVCSPMDADFDGDQVDVFLPLTAAAQREAGEALSVAGRLRRDPGYLRSIQAIHAAKWGLASLSLSPEGRAEIERELGSAVAAPAGYLTKAILAEALDRALADRGVDAVLERLEALTRLGFRAAKESGASMGPFFGSRLSRPALPAGADEAAWETCAEELAARLAAWRDFEDDEMGPVLLGAASGARAVLRQVSMIVGPWRTRSWHGEAAGTLTLRHGYRDGLTPHELRGIVRNHWEGLERVNREWQQTAEGPPPQPAADLHVLARARAWNRPGVVFAAAAATGEVDPLADVDSRLFVGLAPAAGHEPQALGPNG